MMAISAPERTMYRSLYLSLLQTPVAYEIGTERGSTLYSLYVSIVC